MRPGSVPRVPAPEIEGIVLKALREANDTPDQDLSERKLVLEHLARGPDGKVRDLAQRSEPSRAEEARSSLVAPRQPPQATRNCRPTR
jgi:hypothetical protein